MAPSKSTKKKSIANPSGRPRDRPRGKVSAARLNELKAIRDAHKSHLGKSRLDRIVADKDMPGTLRPSDTPVARRIMTRACEARLKHDFEDLERWCKANALNHARMSDFPWRTKFADGTSGPSYHGDGIWECNHLMIT